MANDNYTMEWTLKRDWIDALRSGKYKQARYIYYHAADNAYCCLGVERVVAVGCWDSCTPSLVGDISYDLQQQLIRLNDIAARNFIYIADWIENNVRAVL